MLNICYWWLLLMAAYCCELHLFQTASWDKALSWSNVSNSEWNICQRVTAETYYWRYYQTVVRSKGGWLLFVILTPLGKSHLLKCPFICPCVCTYIFPSTKISISMKFGMQVDGDEWCTTVCSMTWSVVKVTEWCQILRQKRFQDTAPSWFLKQ